MEENANQLLRILQKLMLQRGEMTQRIKCLSVLVTRIQIPIPHKNGKWVWLSSGTWEVETRDPWGKQVKNTNRNRELQVQRKDPASVNKVDNDRGRHLLSTSDLHMHTDIPTHMQTHK